MKAKLLLLLIPVFSILDSYSQDSATIIHKLYKGLKVIPSRNVNAFNYKYDIDQKSRVITVCCTKHIDNDYLKYVIKLKDLKKIFKKQSFSVGDTYHYLGSYFMINGVKASLNGLHSINDNDNILTQISDVWNVYGGGAKIKRITVENRTIYIIQGTDPFCNGRGCSDFIVYILQKQDNRVSVSSLYFGDKSGPYDFDNLKLFFDKGNSDPQLFVPNADKSIKSGYDIGRYSISRQVVNQMQAKYNTVYYKLNDQDRRSYLLSIDQRKVGAPHDTVIFKTKYTIAYVPLKLSNHSKDTLKYMIMSCSWYDVFHINNKMLSIYGWPCDSNFPVDRTVNPCKSTIFNVPVILTKPFIKGARFKIGMNLFMSAKGDERFLFGSSKYNGSNLIWSNEVKL